MRHLFLLVFFIATHSVHQCLAQTPQPLPPVNLGATSFLDGAPPDGDGLYLMQYVQYYGASRVKDGNGQTIPLPGPDLDAWTSLTQLIKVWDVDLGGGAKPALDILVPVVDLDLDFASPIPGPSANSGGLGDILIGPGIQFAPIMGKKGPLFVQRLEAQFILPTGDYDRANEINPGSNFFSFNPYWASTMFLGPKMSASVRAHYLWNATNNAPAFSTGANSTRAGEAFHMNFAFSREILPCGSPSACDAAPSAGPPPGPKLRIGINGYYLKQTTDLEVNGIDVPGFREQVFGIGPGCILSLSPQKHFFFNSYWEDYAENRTEGYRMTLRYVHKF